MPAHAPNAAGHPCDAETRYIRAVVFRESGSWLAQCIEYDICVQAAGLKELYSRLLNTICYECERSIKLHGEPFFGIGPAPAQFEDMWNNRAGDFTPTEDAATHNITCFETNRFDLETGVYA